MVFSSPAERRAWAWGRWLGVMLGLAGLPGMAVAGVTAGPPQEPILRIEAGGPAGAVTHLSVDAAGTLMALASYDKTIRLVSLPDGVERAVLRPPIGAQEEGELYAVALSPDGKTVFAAGATGASWDGSFSIYMFSVAAARLEARLPGLPAPVYDLAVSPDGKFLAAGLAKGGIVEWDAHSGRLCFSDTAYAGPVRNLRFDAQDRLYTASADGHVRGYEAGGSRFADAMPEPGLRPWGLAVSPDGGFVAVDFENDRGGVPVLDVLAAHSLKKVFAPDMSGLSGAGLLAVSWAGANGGTSLLAGGYARNGGGNVIRRWGDFGLGAASDINAAQDTIRDIKALPGGGAVYATEDPGWGRIGPDGGLALAPAPAVADLRLARDAGLGIRADGLAVEFKTPAGIEAFDATARTLSRVQEIDTGFATARLGATGLAVTHWQDTDAPAVNGVRLALDREEYSRSLAVLPDGKSLILGTDTMLRHYDAQGRLLGKTPVDAAAWSVAVNASGTVLVAALLDGTLNWYGINPDGSLTPRASLFTAADDARWVLFTPAGFFDEAELGGQSLVGFHVNEGADQQPDWVSFSQAFRLFHAPDVVSAALAGDDGPQAKAEAAIGDLHDRLVHEPVLSIVSVCAVQAAGCSPVAVSQTAATLLPDKVASLTLQVQAQDRGLGVGAMDIFVNGRNIGRQAAPVLVKGSAVSGVTVPLDPGDNIVILRQYDGGNTVYAESAPLLIGRQQAVPAAAGALYVLAIGIDHFAAADPDLTLDLAVSDATSFSTLVGHGAASLYAQEHVTLLTETEATRAGILAALANIAAAAKPEDTFLFYIASHGGVNATDGRFLLIPQDIKNLSSWPAIEADAITEDALVSAIANIRARDALLFIDTCYAGNVSAASLANVGQETGRYIISASSSTQEALDSYNGRDGLLIYALRQAFGGDAPHDSAGVIGALSLGEYLSEQVGTLAKQRGHTQNAEFTAAQSQLNSFPVGMVQGQ